MSQITYRGNLNAKVFPFVAEYFGRSIIVPGQDQNFSRQLGSNEDPDKDKGIPQVYYCHNVMPSAQGLQSIGYTTPVGPLPMETSFIGINILRDAATGSEVFFSSTSDGRNFVLPFGNPSWRQINTIGGTAGKVVTVAFVNGQTYLYFATIGCYKYVAASDTLVAVTLAGLTVGLVLGITAASGYMLAWGLSTVSWSSTVDPTDFVPSSVTGAGGGAVEAVKGNIVGCVAHQMGFIVYTIENAVAASYSGNAKYPFNYREIVASGGLGTLDYISYDADSGNQYAYTTSGFQLVSMTSSTTVFPELTDFIAGRYFEDFDEILLAFISTSLTSPMVKSVSVVSSRYLVVSYGITSLTHAIVFDMATKRFGKLKIPHVKCFEWKLLTPTVIETPRESLAFLQLDGTIKLVDFTYTSTNSTGILICGKYQYVRSRLLQLEGVDLENVKQVGNFKLYDMYTLDGKNTHTVEGTLAQNTGVFREYKFHSTGVNHSLLFKGGFYLVSIELVFNIHGRR